MQARPQSYDLAERRNATEQSGAEADIGSNPDSASGPVSGSGAAPTPAAANVQARARQLNRAAIAIADKNPIVRAGLADYISRDERFEIRELVSNGAAFIALCERVRIDVGVIGWGLPDMTGGDVLRAVKRRGLQTRVVVYTGDFSPAVLREAVKSGAWGVTSKADDPSVLIDTIASVRAGRMSLPFVDISLLASDPLENLTVREKELLRALAKGWTNEQIASRIGISRNTVKYHLKNLYEKISATNRAQAVAMYLSSDPDRS